MNTRKPRSTNTSLGFFSDVAMRFRLTLRLIADKRVNFLLKLIPVASLLYVIMPVDILPFNPVDDAVLFGMAFYLFVELCPQYVVREHLNDLKNVALDPSWPGSQAPQQQMDGVIEGEFLDAAEEDEKLPASTPKTPPPAE